MERQVYTRMGEFEDRHWWFVARRRIITDALARLVRLPKPARVLEAGCGTGGNLMMLSRFGPVSGFEPEDFARKNASVKGLFDVRKGHLPETVPFAADTFHLAVMLDVLEHLDDDTGSLKALAERVEPGGHVLVTVPAYQFLWSRHDVLHHHKRRYTRRSLLKVARAAGLQPVWTGYFNSLLFPLVALIRLVKFLTGRKTSDDAMPSRPANAVLRTIFGLERRLLGRLPMPFGVSILMIARKPV